MTVKELIEQLKQVENQDMDVIIVGTDHTDYTYYNGVDETRTSLICVNGELEYEIDIDDGDTYDGIEVQEAFIIDGGMF
jgi:hypothetical protein